MHKFIRQLTAGATLLAAALLPQAQAQATVIDFEGAALAGTGYDPGQSFSQDGYVMTAGYSFGSIGTAASLGVSGPSGNATQFYFASNDGDLFVERADGGVFSLDGFSAAYVPLIPVPSLTIVIAVVGYVADPTVLGPGVFFLLPSSTTSSFAFRTYGAANFVDFTNLIGVDFFACALVSGAVDCDYDVTQNAAQFAIDNIRVTAAVPEPETLVLMTAGLLGLALRSRRAR